MEISFKEELVRIEYVIGENTYKTVVEGIIDIPKQKPPIEKILKVSAGIVEKNSRHCRRWCNRCWDF